MTEREPGEGKGSILPESVVLQHTDSAFSISFYSSVLTTSLYTILSASMICKIPFSQVPYPFSPLM
jgi:hypothetical protein